jgi:ligand-binding SRPBCC domain-containing protein
MPVLSFSLTVPAPLAEVWAFHDDVARALPALSPPEARVRVESADVPVRAGSRIVIDARGPLGVRLRWVARIVEHRPPNFFVDEQESGPFAAWRHEHLFEPVGAGHTCLTDRVTYRVPFGPLGVLADHLLVRRQVDAMFRHRHAVLARPFGALAEGMAAGVHSHG